LKSSRAGSRMGLRDWNGLSDTVESTLLNDWSKSFCFGRAAEIGGGSLLFASLCRGCPANPHPPAYFTGQSTIS
jgi:hypothetical protein